MMETIFSHPIDSTSSHAPVEIITRRESSETKAVLSGENVERGILVALAVGALLKKTMHLWQC